MKIQTGHGMITLTALLAIYSISMVTSLPGLAISPILGDLKNIFKDASDLELQMLESLPSFIIVPFILLAGRLSLRINKKRILIIGLSIFFGCSVIYPFSNSLWLLLVVSALLGVGAGMIIPFSTGLIADNFTKRYRTRQLVDHQHHAGSHHLSCWRSRRHQLALRIPRVLPVGDLAVVRF